MARKGVLVMIEFLQKIQDLSFEEVNRIVVVLLIVAIVIKVAIPLFKDWKGDHNELD